MANSSPPAQIRPATPADALDVRRVLDAAMLDFAELNPRIDADDVLVATDGDGSIRGAIVLESETSAVVTRGIETPEHETATGGSGSHREPGAHVDAIAVRTRHRDRGIGSALVESAVARTGRLTVHFDAHVRPFYEALAFEIVPIDDDRYGGIRERRDFE